MMLAIVPAIAVLLAGVELDTALAFVPVLSTSLVSKEIITGTYHGDLVALILLSSIFHQWRMPWRLWPLR